MVVFQLAVWSSQNCKIRPPGSHLVEGPGRLRIYQLCQTSCAHLVNNMFHTLLASLLRAPVHPLPLIRKIMLYISTRLWACLISNRL